MCDIGAYEAGVAAPPTGVVITYLYDNLYRLLAASYSTRLSFNYTYDPVGNRLTQTTLAGTTVYTYDIANRLTNVGSQAYTWDNNGNLLNDGAFTYTYDSANRLTALNTSLYTFGYNGQGDRVLQNANGTPITYTLDLAAGLTQVLAEKAGTATTTYLYGQARIAQQTASSTDYFLPDALGSARELANASANVTLQRSYDPYGQTVSSSGSGSSNYDFTGEYRDQSALLYLRARYYAAQQGRFIQKDSWLGSYIRPQSLNAWAYSFSNPVNHTDPSGNRPCLYFTDNGECVTGPKWLYGPDVPLTYPGQRYQLYGQWYTRTFGGTNVFDLYWCYDTSSGWWSTNSPDQFSLEEFVGMWALFESNSTPEIANVIATVIAQNLYVGGNNPAACTPGLCFDGALNFMAAYSQGQGKLFSGPNGDAGSFARNNTGLGNNAAIRQQAIDLGTKALSPSSVVGDRWNGPSNWGNIQGALDLHNKFNVPIGVVDKSLADNTIYYLNPSFVAYSYVQGKHFKDLGVNFNLAPG